MTAPKPFLQIKLSRFTLTLRDCGGYKGESVKLMFYTELH
jgi:hypothetical protein